MLRVCTSPYLPNHARKGFIPYQRCPKQGSIQDSGPGDSESKDALFLAPLKLGFKQAGLACLSSFGFLRGVMLT